MDEMNMSYQYKDTLLAIQLHFAALHEYKYNTPANCYIYSCIF